MSKGQSLIIQFLLFFVIGLAMFVSIGNIFKLQSDIFREDVADQARKLINSYISSMAIAAHIACMECDNQNNCGACSNNFLIELANTTANYFFEVNLSKSGLKILSYPGGMSYSSSMHNLNESIQTLSGSAPSVKPIILTSSKIQSILEVK
jgi:hypothetical protein